MKIYISHPFGGKPENMKYVGLLINELMRKNPQNTYFSPIHCFGFLYSSVDYQTGLNMCLELLDVCDEMWVFGNYLDSKGCKAEIQHCLDVHKQFYIK